MNNRTGKSFRIPVKLAIYIRTTSDNVDYLHDEYLEAYKNFDIIQFYLDDIHGRQPAFNQLMADARKSMFEIVITKSIMNDNTEENKKRLNDFYIEKVRPLLEELKNEFRRLLGVELNDKE